MHTHARTHAHTHARARVPMHACTHITYIEIDMYMKNYVRVCVRVRVRVRVRVCVCVYYDITYYYYPVIQCNDRSSLEINVNNISNIFCV